ncbi:MAG TPA: 16S rRNA (guanine(966)-N(2))-methyltransferase RsmD [Candidatus Acidoferrum sp.]|nr:16S rRNA (guanine(966)-N(2))-methyltransferase RsmD [Candidatus Acidoferrum sp.]
MRIVAGQFRSRRLRPVGKLALRPTSDMLRETLFNILGPQIEGSLFVDCYAGTGAVGIEALSRGARRAIFIEKHSATSNHIRENLASLGIIAGAYRGADSAEAEILNMDAKRGLAQLVGREEKIEFLFADPPYADVEDCFEALRQFLGKSVLVPTAIVIIEHDSKTDLPEALGSLPKMRELKQGDSSLGFYLATPK